MKILSLMTLLIVSSLMYAYAGDPPKRIVSGGNTKTTIGQVVAGKGNNKTNVGIRRVNVDSTVSTVQDASVRNCEIFPNPCNGSANVISVTPIESIRVADMGGRVVEGCYSDGKIKLPSSGTFMVTIRYQDKTIETRTIISIN